MSRGGAGGSFEDDFENERARHGRLFAREDVMGEIHQILFGERPLYRGWIVLLGSPGVGKSALLVHLLGALPALTAHPTAHHFIRRGIEGRDRPEVVAENLCAQIARRFPECDSVDKPLEARLSDLLKQVSNDVLVPRNERLILVLDALDELAVSSPSENPLPRFLPEILPAGVVIVCATRPKPLLLHWLERHVGVNFIDLNDRRGSASNKAACRAFWEHEGTQFSPPLERVFVDEAIRRAGGNLLHAVLLRQWLLYQPVEQRVATNIPQRLGGFLHQIWLDLLHLDAARRDLVLGGLGLLCAAREALPGSRLAEILGWSGASDIDDFLSAARPFLIEEVATWHGGSAAYRLYHESFREFAIEKLGGKVMREHHARIAETLADWPLEDAGALARGGPERTYALRHGVMHRLEAGDVRAARRLCTDVGYMEEKCAEVGTDAVERDLEALSRALGGDEAMDLGMILTAVRAEARHVRARPTSLPTLLHNRLIRMGWLASRIYKVLTFPAGRAPLRLLYRVRMGASQVRSFLGHDKAVTACVVAPDGESVLSTSTDGSVRLWSLTSGECLVHIRGHDDEVTGCAFTDGGRSAISTSIDATARRWSLESGACDATFPNAGRWATACAATLDGQTIVIGSDDGSVRVWDGRRTRLDRTLLGHTDYITACALTPDGATILSASRDGSVRAWSRSSGQCLYVLRSRDDAEAPALRGMDELRWVTALAVTSDGKRAFAALGDGWVLHWSVAPAVASALRPRRFQVAAGRIDSCSITRDGEHLVCGLADGSLVIWSLTTMRRVDRLSAHAEAVVACAVTPKGERVISASHDKGLKLWELSDLTCPPEESHEGPVNACAAAPDALLVVSASEDKRVKLWDLTTGAPRLSLGGHADLVAACAISHDGKRVASGARDGELCLWNTVSGERMGAVRGHGARVSGCAFTRDGRLVTVSYDRTVRVWGAGALESSVVLGAHEDAVEGCAITPDGAFFLSLSRDGVLKLWNLETSTFECAIEGLGDGLLCGALTPDARRAIVGRDDGLIEVYDIRSGRPLYTLREHEGRVFGCAVSPDGARLVSASEDGTVRVFSLATYARIGLLQGGRWFRCVVATRSRICAGDEEGNLWVVTSEPASARATRKSAAGGPGGPNARRESAKARRGEPNMATGSSELNFSALSYAFADLCDDPSEAALVAREAGLDVRRIHLDGKPIVFWYRIAVEAYRQNRLFELWKIVQAKFPDNPLLVEIGRELGFL